MLVSDQSSPNASSNTPSSSSSGASGFLERNRQARIRVYEKKAKTARLKLQDLAVMTRQLGAMINAGLPLVEALEGLEEQSENPILRIIIRDIRQEVMNGVSLSEAFKKYPNAFPNLLTSMIEAGEAAGNLPEIVLKVSNYFEESLRLEKTVKSALVYPIVIMGLSFVLISVMMVFIIPVFSDLFASVGSQLPLPTRILIAISDFFKSYFLFIVAALFLFWKGSVSYLRTPAGKVLRDKMTKRLPIMGPLSQKIAISRFCRTYSALFRSGVPVIKTIDICARASDNTFIEKACESMKQIVSQGGQLSEHLSKDTYFTPMMTYMTKAGEKTGNIDEMMESVASFYDADINATVKELTSLLEPFMIIFLGVIIGGIVVAMFLPIFELSSAIGGQQKGGTPIPS
jgi:type IV pilus assembly protein PilC